MDYTEGSGLGNLLLGRCYLSEGRHVDAYRCIRKSLELLALEVDETLPQIQAIEALAYLHAQTRQHRLVARLLSASHLQRYLHNHPATVGEQTERDKYVLPMIGLYGQESFDRDFFDSGFGNFQEAVQCAIGLQRFEPVAS